jgi:anaerobic magnesium-protoporphyrin IX monomethyl ester cyclase
MDRMIKVAMIRVPTIVDVSASTAPITPPLGLAYLRRVTDRFPTEVQVIDAVGAQPVFRKVEIGGADAYLLGQNVEEIIEETSSDTDIMLISCMFSQDWLYTRAIINGLKKKCRGALIIAGGEHITAAPDFSIQDTEGLDICVLGEGEDTLTKILESYCAGDHYPQNLPGTVVRTSDGVRRNQGRRRIVGIDTIGWPDWTGFPLENYFSGGFSFGVNLGGARTMPILASRGCPYTCTFCSSPQMWGTKWRARNVDDLIAEIKQYKDDYGATNFDFFDLTAIVRKRWIIEFCEKLIESDLQITWQLPSGTRSEAIDREVADLLFRAGCKNLTYAPESGSEGVLKSVKKRVDLGNLIDSIKGSVEEGLNTKANIMCGFPEEQFFDLTKDLRFITKLALAGCHDLSINQFSPYPGSELFEALKKRGKVHLNEDYFRRLSFYSSMTKAYSYSEYLSSRQILTFKVVGTILFYLLSFLARPRRLLLMTKNVWDGNETTRLEKTLISYKKRLSITEAREVISRQN